MKPASATSTYRVSFETPRPAPKPKSKKPVADPVPSVARLLALAHKVDAMILAGELRDLAHAAETIDVTRARMTQIMNLTLLAPEIQEAVLMGSLATERRLRPITAEPDWNRQLALWKEIHGPRAVLQDPDGRKVHLQDGARPDQGD